MMEIFAAAALARRLMNEHGLHDWGLTFDKAKTRAGVCRSSDRQIGLSRPLTLLHAEDDVRDTVLHEIAHALVGPEHHHDAVWRAKAREIGCSGQRCVAADRGVVPGNWTGRCPAGHTVTRHRRPDRVVSCATCSSRFDPNALIAWTYRGIPVPMRHDPPDSRLLLPAGTQVTIVGAGRYAGLIGRIIKTGRSRYHIVTSQGVLAATPDAVRPL